MIIQIRGTSGSGKTTVVRTFMAGLEWQREYVPGRKKPLYYRCVPDQETAPSLYVLGHYEESACGGCDTIGSARAVYDLIRTVRLDPIVPQVIVCEGLLLSEDSKWTPQLPDVRCLFLTTPLETCLTRIAARRAAAGNDKPLDPENTTRRVEVIRRSRAKLEAAGVYCRAASAPQAVELIRKWVRDPNRLGGE